jgi:hypothetical protein
MKKLLILLSLLITANSITTPALADCSEQIVPALKIAGGTLAAATAIASGTLFISGIAEEINKPSMSDFGFGSYDNRINAPICIGATALSALAFGYIEKAQFGPFPALFAIDFDAGPALKIIGGSLMGLGTLTFAKKLVKDCLANQSIGKKVAPAIFFAAYLACTGTMAGLMFKSAAQDFGLGN